VKALCSSEEEVCCYEHPCAEVGEVTMQGKIIKAGKGLRNMPSVIESNELSSPLMITSSRVGQGE